MSEDEGPTNFSLKQILKHYEDGYKNGQDNYKDALIVACEKWCYQPILTASENSHYQGEMHAFRLLDFIKTWEPAGQSHSTKEPSNE